MISPRSILKRFSADQRGNVAMMFAMSLFPMAGAAGVAIDYSRISSGQASLHAAVDAAALAVAKDPTVGNGSDNASVLAKIKAFMDINLDQSKFKSPPTITVREATEDRIIVEGVGCMPMAFAGFTNIIDPCVKARTAVTRPTATNLEIALALDNSGSMRGGKMTAAKAAAVDFVNAMFKEAKTADQVKVSLVPFTISVNAGAGMSRNSSNIDRNAASSIHWQNILPANTLPPAGVTSRFSLFDQLNENWQGCFEIRPGAFATNDAPPNDSQPDSLFVPMFAPDEPGEMGTNYVSSGLLNPNGWQSGWYPVANSYLNDDGSRDIDYNWLGRETSSNQAACSNLSQAFTLPFNSGNASDWRARNFKYRQTANICRYNLSGTSGVTGDRKRVGAKTGYYGDTEIGPNYMCVSTPIQRLTDQRQSVLTQISRMEALGATNILEGFMWAWRTLSPNAPFADGRSYTWQQPNSSKRNRKVIVIMSDGDNSWSVVPNSPNQSAYSPMGYYHNARFGAAPSDVTAANLQLNQKTLEACNNAKAIRGRDNSDAINVYTIAFSTSDAPISAAGKQLLEDCASMVNGQRQYYPVTSTAQLAEVFKTIAAKIGELKLAE